MKVRHGAALLLILVACGRKSAPEPAAAGQVAALPVTSEWSWHPLGGLAVVEGELGEPTELLLQGRSITERRFAEAGPLRWEFFRPPEGEEAVLRTAEGRELARFRFSTAPPAKQTPLRQARHPEPSPATPAAPAGRPPALNARADARVQRAPVQPLPEPKPLAVPAPAAEEQGLRPKAQAWLKQLFSRPVPEPKARTEARLRTLPVAPIPARPTQDLHPAAAAPAEASSVSLTFTPVVADAGTPPAAKPVVPPAALVTPVPMPSTGTPAWPGMGEGLNLTRAPGGRKRILLSFDGGSSAEVATEVLDLLKARGVRTTLFLTGAFIQRFPALVRRMAAEGHELGNHTMNHPHFAPGMKRDAKWTRDRIQRELLDADAALVKLLGRPMDPFWRAPYGEHTAEIRRWAEELGYRHVGWSEGADTLDWATPKDRRLYRSGEAIVQRLQQRLNRDGDGIIVLMHLGSARSVGDRPTDGLGAFMDRAKKEGWNFVSAGTILAELGKPAWDPHQRLALLNAPAAQSR